MNVCLSLARNAVYARATFLSITIVSNLDLPDVELWSVPLGGLSGDFVSKSVGNVMSLESCSFAVGT